VPKDAHLLLALGRFNQLAIALRSTLELISAITERDAVAGRVAQGDCRVDR
jgi:hypothetical protein